MTQRNTIGIEQMAISLHGIEDHRFFFRGDFFLFKNVKTQSERNPYQVEFLELSCTVVVKDHFRDKQSRGVTTDINGCQSHGLVSFNQTSARYTFSRYRSGYGGFINGFLMQVIIDLYL